MDGSDFSASAIKTNLNQPNSIQSPPYIENSRKCLNDGATGLLSFFPTLYK